MILHSPAYEGGTDSEFRNVSNQNSDAGELPKKEQITFRTRRKLKNKNAYFFCSISAQYVRLQPEEMRCMKFVQTFVTGIRLAVALEGENGCDRIRPKQIHHCKISNIMREAKTKTSICNIKYNLLFTLFYQWDQTLKVGS